MATQTYQGGCHCGAVQYEVQADIENVIACNCSRCSMLGWLLTFVPATQFTLRSGEDNLTEYRFNTKRIAHLFCKTCGIESFSRGSMPDGTETIAVNVRCLQGVDPATLNITAYDGRSH